MNAIKHKKTCMFVLVFLCVCLISSCLNSSPKGASVTNVNGNATSINTAEVVAQKKFCMPPLVKEFAYTVSRDENSIAPVTPLAPWEAEATLPTEFSSSKYESLIISRTFDNQVELWFSMDAYDPFLPEYSTNPQFAIYFPIKKEWEFISAETSAAGVFVYDLFVLPDGSVWGQNVKDEKLDIQETPFLSKYNEKIKKFEPIKESLGIPMVKKELPNSPGRWSKTITDSAGVFWIFAHTDAIYSFDSAQNLIVRHTPLPNYVSTARTTSAGDIYINSGDIFFSTGKLFRYSPRTNIFEMVPIPLEPFPTNQSIYVDSKGRLWLDNLGWLEPDGRTWYQIQRSPLFITNILWTNAEYRWKSGIVELESSDGILWYYSENGMISLNPEKGDWCWFTTYQSNIVEDSSRNLWMIADNKLFRLTLK